MIKISLKIQKIKTGLIGFFLYFNNEFLFCYYQVH